jgi:hypothetical protein
MFVEPQEDFLGGILRVLRIIQQAQRDAQHGSSASQFLPAPFLMGITVRRGETLRQKLSAFSLQLSAFNPQQLLLLQGFSGFP